MFRNLFTRISYIVLIVLFGLAFLFYRNYFLLLFMLVMILFPMITIPLVFYLRGLVSLHIECPAQVEKDAPVTVRLHLHNEAILPVIITHSTLRITQAFYPGGPLHHFANGIPARGDSFITFTMTPTKNGLITLKLEQLRLWDYSGLFDITWHGTAEASMVVMPKADDMDLDISSIGGAGLCELSEQDVKGNDSSTVIDTRDYRPGDKLQRIHWKLSTKIDKLLVKEYGSISSQDVLVVLDMTYRALPTEKRAKLKQMPTNEGFDMVFDLFMSLSTKLLKDKRPFMVGWYSKGSGELHLQEVSTKEMLSEAIHLMYYEQPYEEVGPALSLARALMADYGELLYIAPSDAFRLTKGVSADDILLEKKQDAAGAVLATVHLT